ncbi:GTP-binding protein [Falsiroseomonas sp.]|uniref:GTP-binding protein n=1 Tax=Falsiroseomonas sp. TaxID=2870721 RepID=UPI003F6FD81E
MRIRVLKAASMPEAMARLRDELGPDAALLSSRPVNGGVEVTGGLDLDDEDEELPVLIGPRPRAPLPAACHQRRQDDSAAIALDFHRVPDALARRLCAAPLEASLEASLRFARLPDGVARPLLLAGPPGAGKTLTCAKLAARRVLEGEEPPLVISADGERPAAAEQLAAFTQLLGATLAVALTPAAVALAMEQRSPGQPVLIDTAGCDPFDPAQARMIASLVAVTGASVALVLPGSMDAAEAADVARAFGALGATHLVATRLDASRRIGAVLAAAATAGLALAEAGTGSQAADGLTMMEPAWLAARLRRRSHIEVSAWEGVGS